MRRLVGILLPVVAILMFYGQSEANVRQGPYIGADIVINVPEGDLSGDFADVNTGAGLDLKFGYIFPAPLALEIEWGATGHDVEGNNGGIGFFVIDLRYFITTDRPLNPYIRFGLGSYALVIKDVFDPLTGLTDDMKLTGSGFDIGLGFDYYANPNVTFGAGITQRFITYDDIDYLIYSLVKDVNGNMTSLNFGVQYHF